MLKVKIIVICIIFMFSCGRIIIPTHVRLRLNDDSSSYSICDSAGTVVITVNEVINGKEMSWYNVGGSMPADSEITDYRIRGGKWGIMRNLHTPEQDYQFITEAVFDDFLPFSENLGAARIGNLWGFVDTLGRWSIPAQYDTAGMRSMNGKGWYGIFLHGTAWVNQDGKAFRIDGNGRTAGSKTYHIDPRFVYIAERNTRLFEYENYQLLWKAAWFEESGRWGILRNDETVLMPPSVSVPVPFHPFRDGAVWLKKGSKYGLWKDGLWVIPPHFDIIRVYPTHTWVNVESREREEGLFLNQPADMGVTWGLIDSTGKVIINPGKDGAAFGGESIPIRHNGKWQYLWKGIYLESPVSEDFMSSAYLNSSGITISGNNAQVVSDDIRIFLGVKWTDLYSCYVTEQKVNPDLKGKLRWTAVLSKNGRPEKIEIQDNTLGETISSCVRDKIRQWIFPVQGIANLTVQQLLVFTP